jgi:DNA-binding MarR family transcriptional regulator
MTPVQSEVYEIIERYWKKYECSPSYRDIAQMRGVSGVSSVKKIIDRLEKLGAVKRMKNRRSVRPVYIKFVRKKD